MGFGYALGGAAEGFKDSTELSLKSSALKQAGDQEVAKNGILLQGLQIKQQQIDQKVQQARVSQADKIIDGQLKIVKDVITHARAAGKSEDEIKQTIAPWTEDITKLATATGRDPAILGKGIDAMIAGYPAKVGIKVGQTMEIIRDKIANGQPLTPGEQKLADQAQSQASWMRGFMGLGDEPAAAAPAAAPTTLPAPAAAAPAAGIPVRKVQTTSIPAPDTGQAASPSTSQAPVGQTPPVPAALAGKNPHWSPSQQRWFTGSLQNGQFVPDGNLFNQQGVPLQ